MIGYAGRRKEEFIENLKRCGIQLVVDVRRFPKSKDTDFEKRELERWLREEGIEYVWLGRELGGFRRGGYEKYMVTGDFERGIKTLLKFVEEYAVAVMCMERKMKYCHRRFIAERLRREGINVQEIK